MGIVNPASARPPHAMQGAASRRAQRGATFVELAVVVVILATVAALVTLRFEGTSRTALRTTTLVSMEAIRTAIVGRVGPDGVLVPGFFQDTGRLPMESLEDLLVQGDHAPFSPSTQRGWRGPYLRSGSAAAVIDDSFVGSNVQGRGNPIVLQVPLSEGSETPTAADVRHARLVSGGPDGEIETPVAAGEYFPPRASSGDDIVLYLFAPDLRP